MDSSQLLILHSYFRWIVLAAMLIQGIWLWTNYKSNKVIRKNDLRVLLFFTLIYNTQLILGWTLYSNSLLVENFWMDITKGLKNRQLRFFGLEHMSMMTCSIILINYCTYYTYKQRNKTQTFKYLIKYYIWIYLMILSSIPWSFSPLTNRPDFR